MVVGTPSSSTKAESEKEELVAFTFPSFATIFHPSSVLPSRKLAQPLATPSFPSPLPPPPPPPCGTFSQQRFSAFDICDLNFRYREFPGRKCRLIVPSVTLPGSLSPLAHPSFHDVLLARRAISLSLFLSSPSPPDSPSMYLSRSLPLPRRSPHFGFPRLALEFDLSLSR